MLTSILLAPNLEYMKCYHQHFLSKINIIYLILLFYPLLVYSITLAWDHTPDIDIISGYKIYWRESTDLPYTTNQMITVGITNELTIDNSIFQTNTIYFFVITAFTTNGTESDFSNEIFDVPVKSFNLTNRTYINKLNTNRTRNYRSYK